MLRFFNICYLGTNMVEGSGDYEASKPENVDILLGVLMFRKS